MDHLAPTWVADLTDGRRACVVMTERLHGDLAVTQPAAVVEARRRAVVDAPWTWLDQVHGAEVVVVQRPGHHAGRAADGACTAVPHAPLAVNVADCAPVALVAEGGVVAALHAGWRGLVAGVVDAGVAAVEALGGTRTRALVGPCIGPDHYEFGAADLDIVEEVLGASARSRTGRGRPALDLRRATVLALTRAGVDRIEHLDGCTATDLDRRWSHRARTDSQRQAMVVWLDDRAGD